MSCCIPSRGAPDQHRCVFTTCEPLSDQRLDGLMVVIDADDAAGLVDLHLNLARARLARVGGLEDLGHLLERLAGRLDEEEVDDDELDADPADVDQVEAPLDLLHAHADAVRVDDHGDVQEQEVEAGPLGPHAVVEHLDGVQRLQRREAPREADAEQVDGHDGAVRQVGVLGRLGREGRQHAVAGQRAAEPAQHHGAAPELVEQGRAVRRRQHGEDGADRVDQQLLVGVGDAGRFHHDGLRERRGMRSVTS